MASVSAVGAVIAYAGGDRDTAAVVMDGEAEISPKEEGEVENRERRGGRGRRRWKEWVICEVDCM